MKVFDCQHCQQPFQVGPEHAGMAVACPACGQANRIAKDAFVSKPSTSQVFACPSCEGKFQVPLSMEHRTVACPHCQKPVAIPSSQSSGESSPGSDDQQVEVPSIKPKPLKSRKQVRKTKAKRRGTQPFVPPSDDLFAPGFSDGKSEDKEKPAAKEKPAVKEKPAANAPPVSKKPKAAPKPKPGAEENAPQGDVKRADNKGKQPSAKSIDRSNDRLTPPPKPKSKTKAKSETKAAEQTKVTGRKGIKLPPGPEPAKKNTRGADDEGKQKAKTKSKAKSSAAKTAATGSPAEVKSKASSDSIPTSDSKTRSETKSKGKQESGASSPKDSKKKDQTPVSTKPVIDVAVDKGASENVVEASVAQPNEKAKKEDAGKQSKATDRPAVSGKDKSANEASGAKVEPVVAATSATTETIEPPVFGKKSIDHLLPPKFDVIDPQRLSISLARDDNKVFLPGADGGTVRVDKRIVHVQHGQDKVSLVVLSPEQRERRRLIQNSIVILIGMLLIAATLWMLLN